MHSVTNQLPEAGKSQTRGCIHIHLECLPLLLHYMVRPYIAEVLLATVASIYDHSVSKSNSRMTVSDRRSGSLYIRGVPGVCVHVKHCDVIQVWLRQRSCGALHARPREFTSWYKQPVRVSRRSLNKYMQNFSAQHNSKQLLRKATERTLAGSDPGSPCPPNTII